MTALVRAAVLLALAISNTRGQATQDLPPAQHSHRVVLDQDNAYVMLWTPRQDAIEIEVQVKAKGYVGLGFSLTGGMKGADIVLGWVDDAGRVFLHDRYAAGNWAPAVDESQDVTLLGGYQNDTHTVLRFSRPWITLDTDSDYMLGDDTVRVIWAYSNSDPTSETELNYHDKRGTKSLYLQSPQFELPPLGPDVKSVEFLSRNITIPSDMDTLYWCQLFKIPNVTTKHHVIGYVPVLQQESLEHVHHIVMYVCDLKDGHDQYERWLEWEGTQCHTGNMPPSWKFCSPIFAWAVGGEGEMFPEHVGFPIGEQGKATYFMMEMHYDNPNFREGVVDSSGVRFFYTDKLREHDAGTIVFGHNVSPLHIIPPVQRWQSSGYCDPQCTSQNLPAEGVKIFQGLLHSHLLGDNLILRHGRNGQELPPIMKDMHYDFDYQNTRILKEEVTILPGDSLVMDCGYNASQRTSATYGGFGTNEEMCLTFLSYYPRTDLFLCTSHPELDTILGGLGLGLEISADNRDEVNKMLNYKIEMNWEAENKLFEKVKSGNLSSEPSPLIMSHILKAINITAPQKYFNRSLYSVLQDRAIWMDEGVTSSLQKAVLEGKHTSACHLHGQDLLLGKGGTITAPDLQPLQESLPEVTFMHSVVLDQQGSYVLLWTPRKEDVVFEVQVGTTGYVGLGFSPTGGMKGADIILGWVDTSGEVFLHDRHAEGNSAPMLDQSQDVKLLGGYQNDTHTVLRFSRPWDTCDGEQDYVLSDDTVRVIWSYSNRDPTSETNLHYHDRRGTKSLFLQSPQFEMPEMGPDVKTWEFLSPNVSLPNDFDTLYWCKIYKMPPTTTKHHIIGFVPVVEEKNAEHVHHILFYECHAPDSDTLFEQHLEEQGAQCHTPNMPSSFNHCQSVLIAWAIGGQGEMYPEHAGFPIGEQHGGATYFMMETHYDNPNLRQGVVDSSGIKIFYTEKLRQHDAGILMIGHQVSFTHIIPPRQESFLTGTFCDGSCTGQTLPEEGVRVFQGILHSHLLGTSLLVRQVRAGQELPMLLKDLKYDFNYQSTRVFKEEVTLLPGDTLITECYYNSSQRTKPTSGGLSTKDEMCLAFFSYYPRTSFFSCLSEPKFDGIIAAVGVTDVAHDRMGQRFRKRKKTTIEQPEENMTERKERDMTQELKETKFSDFYHTLKITAPEEYQNLTMHDILYNEATWQDPMVADSFQRLATSGIHNVICSTNGQNAGVEISKQVPYPSYKSRRHRPDRCSQLGGGSSVFIPN
ncbi:hypothetical protein O3P69_016584 [Scylla paramamosain]|uniref:DOMON domain-containing protein n=1 Tax=Scylla paramamosain TaxID=85552 RepID=A0AAW0SZC1_SCYPA